MRRDAPRSLGLVLGKARLKLRSTEKTRSGEYRPAAKTAWIKTRIADPLEHGSHSDHGLLVDMPEQTIGQRGITRQTWRLPKQRDFGGDGPEGGLSDQVTGDRGRGGTADDLSRGHGPSVPSIAWGVRDATACPRGARPSSVAIVAIRAILSTQIGVADRGDMSVGSVLVRRLEIC